MRRPGVPGGIVGRNYIADQLLDCGAVSVAHRWHRKMLDKLLSVGVVASTERAGVHTNHRLAQRVMQHGQEKGVADGRPRPWPDHVIRTIAATRNSNVVFVVGIAGFKR